MEDFLINLRKNCESIEIPIISVETQNFLYKFLYKNRPKICLEIGGAVGYSSMFIANIIKDRDGIIYSFEIAHATYIQGLKNIKESGLTNIVFYPFDANKINPEKFVNKGVDFVFIDGQKSQYANYLMKIQNIISGNGVFILDDVIKYHNKLSSLYGYLKEKQIFYKIIKTEPGDGIMLI